MIHLNHQAPTAIPGKGCGVFTHGSTGSRFGGAHPDGTLGLHWYVAGKLQYRRIKCSSYREAQRKLLQYLKGYNVCG